MKSPDFFQFGKSEWSYHVGFSNKNQKKAKNVPCFRRNGIAPLTEADSRIPPAAERLSARFFAGARISLVCICWRRGSARSARPHASRGRPRRRDLRKFLPCEHLVVRSVTRAHRRMRDFTLFFRMGILRPQISRETSCKPVRASVLRQELVPPETCHLFRCNDV